MKVSFSLPSSTLFIDFYRKEKKSSNLWTRPGLLSARTVLSGYSSVNIDPPRVRYFTPPFPHKERGGRDIRRAWQNSWVFADFASLFEAKRDVCVFVFVCMCLITNRGNSCAEYCLNVFCVLFTM